MKAYTKVWLWLLLVSNAFSMAAALMAALAAPLFWLYVLYSAGILAGVVLLLFLRRKLGFYLFCGVSVLGLILNFTVTQNLAGAFLETAAGILITCLLLHGSWESLS